MIRFLKYCCITLERTGFEPMADEKVKEVFL
jgi:hypothetical protein